VPVTARLSRRFYERFGDELTNELVDWFNQVDATYRLDLRELNDRNFVRFDATLEQRLAQVQADLRTEFRTGIASLEARLITWMFIFWAGTLGTMIALVKL